MVKKVFLPMEEVRDGAFKLAEKIMKSSFKPTILYSVMRGGSYIANPISEYFIYHEKMQEKDGGKVERLKYGVIVGAQSYQDVGQRKKVKKVSFLPGTSKLTMKDRVLVVDDIIDEGQTIEAIIKKIEKETPLRLDQKKPLSERQIVIVSHDVKIGKDGKKIMPDYYINAWNVKDEAVWIFYTSHEMVGMEKDEIKKNYGHIL
ncbi:hypothetical protein HY643_04890 [Candidatus Woesearchaeota archaeon]|nr:hypothetical protein [Candidatus Woesearchaeota archaeon]